MKTIAELKAECIVELIARLEAAEGVLREYKHGMSCSDPACVELKAECIVELIARLEAAEGVLRMAAMETAPRRSSSSTAETHGGGAAKEALIRFSRFVLEIIDNMDETEIGASMARFEIVKAANEIPPGLREYLR